MLTHLLYLQAWMAARKSPLSTQLNGGVSGALSKGRSGLRRPTALSYRRADPPVRPK